MPTLTSPNRLPGRVEIARQSLVLSAQVRRATMGRPLGFRHV